MQSSNGDDKVRPDVEGIVEVAGAWYARHGALTIGPLGSAEEVRAFVDLLDVVAAARGVPSPPVDSQS